MENTPTPSDSTAYQEWLVDWKKRIQSAQIKAALRVNAELLSLYWELGQDIAARQEKTAWGEGLIPRFAKDLKLAFPHLTGFSLRNLFYVRKWYLFYCDELASPPIVPQLVAQLPSKAQLIENELSALFFAIPWGHHRHILDKCADTTDNLTYFPARSSDGRTPNSSK